MARYENLGEQSKDARNAVRMLPKAMRRGLGQSPEDIAGKVSMVASAVAAGAKALENPVKTATPTPAPSVAVDFPYVPVGLALAVVVGLFFLFKKK